MMSDAAIQLGVLRFSQRERLGLQAFPDRVQQFRLLDGRQAFYLIAQIAHC